MRRRETCKVVHAASAALGLEIPEGAVERVARGAGRHRILQIKARQAGSQACTHRLDRRADILDALAVAGIGHALATPARLTLAQFGDHHGGLGLGAAADGEGAADRPALDGDAEGQRRGHGLEDIHRKRL